MPSTTKPSAAGSVAHADRALLTWLAVLATFGIVFYCDFVAVPRLSLGLFYVLPVTLATSFLGMPAGSMVALLSTAARLLSGLNEGLTPMVAGWNAGMLLGMLSTFTMLVHAMLRQDRRLSIVRILMIGTAVGSVAAFGLAVAGSVQASTFQRVLTAIHPSPALSPSTAHLATALPPIATLDSLQQHALHSLPMSRAILLGSRNAAGQSCIQPVPAGSLADHVPPDMGDFNGGPGTTITVLLTPGRQSLQTASDDLDWHQSRLRQFLANQDRFNEPAQRAAEQFHAVSRALADQLAASNSFPVHVRPVAYADETTWPGFCLCRLNEAVRNRDLGASKRWSMELATATFWLADLHRWLDLLVDNYATALDFQRACPEPFRAADAGGKRYDIFSSISALPAGMLTLHGRANFLEVERQAERVFHMPPDRLEAIRDDRYTSDESIAVPPARRDIYTTFASCLSPANRRTLAAAARTPYECSFLINMLFRMESSDVVTQECEALRRFDRLTPNATVEQLMGVLFYRGHSFSGLEWGDRFQPYLIEEAADLPGKSAEAFRAACRKAHALADRGGQYGPTLTLRDAFNRGVFDCIRTTDLAITLFRNSGRSGVGHVRWTAGTDAHAVAAHWGAARDSGVLVIDPMALDEEGRWPELYFRGAVWPESLPGRPQPYAVEFYVRGLDNYIWAEGYSVRGHRAGTLVSHAIPYLKGFDTTDERQAYPGPYPGQ